MQSGYRPDIDGLRAVAIIPVLLFHAGISQFSGGYVGVDIFFVISGFLITQIIVRELDAGTFSITRFYERRARRILPLLITVLVTVTIASIAIDLPSDLEAVQRSVIATVLFVSNFHFFADVGYFSQAAETKPLLHTWSLAVEEQFYIGFPILLLFLAKHAPSARALAISAIAVVSLGLAISLQGDKSGFNFYMLPTRAWELMAGALIALRLVPEVEKPAARELVAVLGCAAIGYSIFAFDGSTPFPGIATLLPVLGAAALIHAAPGTSVGKLLALAPVRGVGLISFSLYLWHWPLIVFAHRLAGTPFDGGDKAALIVASLGIAILSWRFIEQPFRRQTDMSSATVLRWSGLSLAAIGTVGSAILVSGGIPGRFPAAVVGLAEAGKDISPFRVRCHGYDVRGEEPCVLGAATAPRAVLWGDSHGVELSYALAKTAQAQGWSLVQRTHSSCPPVLDTNDQLSESCASANRSTFSAIIANRAIETVYLSAFWTSKGYRHLAPQLEATITALLKEGKQIVVFGPVPSAPFDVPRTLARLASKGQLATARGRSRAKVIDEAKWFYDVVNPLRERLTIVEPTSVLCDEEWCDVIRDGKPLLFDFNHLSTAGADLVVARAFAAFPSGPSTTTQLPVCVAPNRPGEVCTQPVAGRFFDESTQRLGLLLLWILVFGTLSAFSIRSAGGRIFPPWWGMNGRANRG